MYITSFDRFALQIPRDAVEACSGPGSADDSVRFWAPKVDRPSDCTPEALAAELKEYGAWDEIERQDDDANWERIVWIACNNIRDDLREAIK